MNEITVAAILFIVGLVLIIKGGDIFVDAATWMAEASGIPKFIIGATVVSVATTLPELLVSILAAIDNETDIAIGNAVGSVTANTGMIMAIAIICMPVLMKRAKIMFKGIMLVIVSGLLALLCYTDNSLAVLEGLILLVIFGVYVFQNISEAKQSMGGNDKDKVEKDTKTVLTNITKFIIGAAGIAVGARLLVDNATTIAESLKISKSIISVTIVAIGTSLPELVTMITAVRKKQASLTIGNIIGANIIDLTLIMPICAIISGKVLVPQDKLTTVLDIPVCFIIVCIGIIPSVIRQKFTRMQGILMLAAYIAYLAVKCSGILNGVIV